jgi:hypothetical protein
MGSLPSCLGRDVEVWHVLEIEDTFFAETVLAFDDHGPENLAEGLCMYC